MILTLLIYRNLSKPMNINKHFFKVGGFVRDTLLGLEPKDIDYVVVGLNEDDMLLAGYKCVGADFPVFLHPETKDEYALARIERSTGVGYKDFECIAHKDVTLEEDLYRRDLTINAIAMNEEGDIIDPYEGRKDLENRVLRHVSEAFIDDPLRVLRVARFMARYGHLGFTIDSKTEVLMRNMCNTNMLNHLSKERIWKETEKALMEPNPRLYFETLLKVNGLKDWFPELESLKDVPQPLEHHPENCTWEHTLLCLDESVKRNAPAEVRWAVMCHDLGKALTPKELLPKHHDHEEKGVPLVKALCFRLGTPKKYTWVAEKVCRLHLNIHRSLDLKPKTLLSILKECNYQRALDDIKMIVDACECDAKGRTGFSDKPYPQREFVLNCAKKLNEIDEGSIALSVDNKKIIPQRIHEERMRVIKKFKKDYTSTCLEHNACAF